MKTRDLIRWQKMSFPIWKQDILDTMVLFKVYTRRAKKSYPITSMEVSAAIGEKILDAFPDASVDVHNPEMTLSVEIRDKIYVYSETLPGPGGMPIGTNGKQCSLPVELIVRLLVI